MNRDKFDQDVKDKMQDINDYFNFTARNKNKIKRDYLGGKRALATGAIGAATGAGLGAAIGKTTRLPLKATTATMGALGGTLGQMYGEHTNQGRKYRKLLKERFGENAPKMSKFFRNNKHFENAYYEGLKNERNNKNLKQAIELVNEEYEKIASFKSGLAAGALGGAMGGFALGDVLSKVTTSPKAKALKKELDSLKEEENNWSNRYKEKAFPASDFVSRLEANPNYNKLSVKDIDNLAREYYSNNIKNLSNEKVASEIKSSLIGALASGVPIAAGTGAWMFNDARKKRNDTVDLEEAVNEKRRSINRYKNGKVPFENFVVNNEHNIGYGPNDWSPYMYLDNKENNKSTLSLDLNDELERRGKDYKKMNFKDYDNLVNRYNDVNKNGYVSASNFLDNNS